MLYRIHNGELKACFPPVQSLLTRALDNVAMHKASLDLKKGILEQERTKSERLQAKLDLTELQLTMLKPVSCLIMRGMVSRALLVRVRKLCLEKKKDINVESWLSIQRSCKDEEFSSIYHRALESLNLDSFDIDVELLDGWKNGGCDIPTLSFPATSQELVALVDGYDAPSNIESLCKALYIPKEAVIIPN